MTLDVRGSSSDLEVGWNLRTVKVTSFWGIESVLGLNVHALYSHTSFTMVNIYGPYLNRVPFLE